LFIIAPGLNVSSINALPLEDGKLELTNEDVAGIHAADDDTTLVTNNEVPPFWK
jgi:hypothetical protein